MIIEDQYGVGDVIDTGVATGTVEGVSLRTTRLRDAEGTVWHIPNGGILRVGNKSQQWTRVIIDVAVAYDADLPSRPTRSAAPRKPSRLIPTSPRSSPTIPRSGGSSRSRRTTSSSGSR